jgi:hypothetical protein
VGDHTKSTNPLTCVGAYQTLPYFSQAWHKPVVVLVWSTNCYHSRNLGQTLPQETFTNHYHRGEGQGIDLSVGVVFAGMAGWLLLCRVITVENRGHTQTVLNGRQGVAKNFFIRPVGLQINEHGGKTGMAMIKYPGY